MTSQRWRDRMHPKGKKKWRLQQRRRLVKGKATRYNLMEMAARIRGWGRRTRGEERPRSRKQKKRISRGWER